VQGIIDAYFEEDGRLVIVDYKTDRVKSAYELKERYRGQMRWYARALEQLTGMETGGCYLVSIELDEIISL
jgi:ATP-dependent helicase/nuclease subunit A